MDSVDLFVMDIEGSQSDLLLPGIKALQVPLIVPNKPAAAHTQALRHYSCFNKPCLVGGLLVWWRCSTATAQQVRCITIAKLCMTEPD